MGERSPGALVQPGSHRGDAEGGLDQARLQPGAVDLRAPGHGGLPGLREDCAKFEAVDSILRDELEGTGVASWNKPDGGYFISLFVMKGTAGKTVAAAKKAGVLLTPAGATYPYGKDPDDSNIRIAPTLPSLGDIQTATRVLGVCAKLVAIEHLLEK